MLERIAEAAPALTWLLRESWSMLGESCKPYDCHPFSCICPFATPEPDPHNPKGGYSGGSSERYFACSLLTREHIWGEAPPCTDEQWRDRAIEELEALLDNTESSVES